MEIVLWYLHLTTNGLFPQRIKDDRSCILQRKMLILARSRKAMLHTYRISQVYLLGVLVVLSIQKPTVQISPSCQIGSVIGYNQVRRLWSSHKIILYATLGDLSINIWLYNVPLWSNCSQTQRSILEYIHLSIPCVRLYKCEYSHCNVAYADLLLSYAITLWGENEGSSYCNSCFKL